MKKRLKVILAVASIFMILTLVSSCGVHPKSDTLNDSTAISDIDDSEETSYSRKELEAINKEFRHLWSKYALMSSGIGYNQKIQAEIRAGDYDRFIQDEFVIKYRDCIEIYVNGELVDASTAPSFSERDRRVKPQYPLIYICIAGVALAVCVLLFLWYRHQKKSHPHRERKIWTEKKVKWVRFTAVFFFSLSIPLLSFSGLGIFNTYKNNQELIEKLQNKRVPDYHDFLYSSIVLADEGLAQYANKVPMEQMDLVALDYEHGAYALPYFEIDNLVRLPIDITYYQEVNGIKTPVKTLQKGQWVYTQPTVVGMQSLYGYGLSSYPTYQKGWRYVIPFVTTEEAFFQVEPHSFPKILSQEHAPFYYVRLEDLESVAEVYAKERYTDFETYTLSDRVYSITRDIDFNFLQQGQYLSPDIPLSVWTVKNIILLSTATISLLLSLFLFQQAKRHKP